MWPEAYLDSYAVQHSTNGILGGEADLVILFSSH